ncbi:MAG: type I glutamate--ammonia ligase [Deltaproteobacteria bacterium]|nr:type I glutamate--ammonia ligase [Deltaproteobacteria bacterium]
MFSDHRELLRWLEQSEIQFVDLLYVNLFGGVHHVTLPVSRVKDRLFVEGVGVDGSSVPGFKKLESGDVSAIPDPTTAWIDPTTAHPTLAVLCDIVEADTKVPLAGYPREVARRAEAYLTRTGHATRSVWGPEFEYYLFDEVTHACSPTGASFQVHSRERASGLGDAPSVRQQRGYHASRPADRLHDVRSETVRVLEKMGVPVVYHHHEVGALGQVEFEIEMRGLLQSGDAVIKGKLAAKLVAQQHGMVATFMPKPLFGQAGTGMHFHQHLFMGEAPLFYQQGTYADLSPLALSYTAGLLDHGGALLALTNPSTNSYRRLVPGFEAPIKAFFSLGNRSAAIRVPRYAIAPLEKRIEFRPPDATANPYLAMAAMLMAGIDGIERQLDPTAMGFGPFDANVEHLPQAERDAITSLPSTLEQATAALREDHDFLLRGGVFPPSLLDSWLHGLTENAQALARRPHPFEYDLYLDV